MTVLHPNTLAISTGRPPAVPDGPLNLPITPVSGADVVVHSATKAIGGHSDLLPDAAVVADHGHWEQLSEIRTVDLLRVSVGCENVEDLWNDLQQALDRTSTTPSEA